MAMPGEE